MHSPGNDMPKLFCFIKSVSTRNINHIFNVEAIRNFPLKLLSMIFKKNIFFRLNFSWGNCSLEKTFDVTLKKHAPLKKEMLANQAPFINKTVTKEVMKRSWHETDGKVYNKQRNDYFA